MNKKLAILSAALLFGTGSLWAQKRVTGHVVDEHGQPVSGATVKVNGTKVVTITDDNGYFSLPSVPNDAKSLLVSYVGYETQAVSVAGNVNVVMKEDDNALNEVMVVAYGTQKKSSFTGSAGVIKSDKIEARVQSNVTNSLSGQVAGVQTFSSSGEPGSGASIRIRGIGSRSASSAPLYVVDGVPYDGSISSINPADIESITVLKDAAANAIYGARGANGVILITTKQGKSGDAVVTLDAKWGSNRRAVPNYTTLGTAAYVETAYRALYNSQYLSGKSDAAARAYADSKIWGSQDGGLGYQIYTVPEGQRLVGTNFKLNPAATLGYTDGEYYYTPDNWYDEFFGKGNLRQEYNINVSGRTDKMSYYASAAYLQDNGLVRNSAFTRYSGRGKIDYQAKKWLKIGTNMSFSQTESNGNGSSDWGSSGNLFYVANMIGPIYPLYVRDADGNIKYEPATGTPLYDNGGTATNFQRSYMANSRPGAIIDNDRKVAYNTTFTGKWYATITPIEGLSLTANIAATEVNERANYLYSRWGSSSVTTDGSTYVAHSRTSGVNTQYLATYTKTIKDVHNIDLLVGYESYKLKMQGISGLNDHLYDPFIGELNNAGGTSNKQASSYTTNYMTQGILSRVQYNYAEKYFLSGSFRRDASSRFSKEHRWGNFGSVGLAWLISKEDFMDAAGTWLDELKVKASWGAQGNDALLDQYGYANYYPYLDQYNVTYSEDTGEYSKTLTYAGNEEITWETNHTYNVGIDFSLFNSRLTGTLEYFNRKTVDMLYHRSVPLSSGVVTGFIDTNVGSMRNSGVELDLTAYIFKRHDLEWSVSFNLTHFKNKVLSLDEGVAEEGIRSSSSIVRVGGSLYNSYLVRFAGVDPETGVALYYKNPDGVGYKTDAAGNFLLDENGKRIPNDADWSTTSNYSEAQQSDLGTTLPKVYGGFGTSLRWKGLDFSIQLSYQLGGHLYDATYQDMMHTGNSNAIGSNWHEDILNAWTPENRFTNVPRVNSYDDVYQQLSDRFRTSSDYLSLNNITLGYTLPESLTHRWNIAGIRLYVTGDNLGVLSARKGLDPRFTISGVGTVTTTSSGINYSAMRSISGGITLTF